MSKDGLEFLTNMFKNEDDFIQFAISTVQFFDREIVKNQWNDFLKLEKVTNSTKEQKHIAFCRVILHDKKSRTESNRLSITNPETYTTTLPDGESVSIKTATDPDGNYYPRINSIYNYTGILTSSGSRSTIKNYTITHIWGNYGRNPYAFCCLWNLSLTPTFLSSLTDGNPTPGTLRYKFQKLFHAVAYNLYKDINSGWIERSSGLVKTDDFQDFNDMAAKLINEGKINLIGAQNFPPNVPPVPPAIPLGPVPPNGNGPYTIKYNGIVLYKNIIPMPTVVENVIKHYINIHPNITLSYLADVFHDDRLEGRGSSFGMLKVRDFNNNLVSANTGVNANDERRYRIKRPIKIDAQNHVYITNQWYSTDGDNFDSFRSFVKSLGYEIISSTID